MQNSSIIVKFPSCFCHNSTHNPYNHWSSVTDISVTFHLSGMSNKCMLHHTVCNVLILASLTKYNVLEIFPLTFLHCVNSSFYCWIVFKNCHKKIGNTMYWNHTDQLDILQLNGGNEKWYSFSGNQFGRFSFLLQIVIYIFTIWLRIFISKHYSKEMKNLSQHKDLPWLFISSFVMAKIWQKPQCPSPVEYIDNCAVFIQWDTFQQ